MTVEDLSGTKLNYEWDTSDDMSQDTDCETDCDQDCDPDCELDCGSIFQNYDKVISWPIIKRSFENLFCFYLVFKPFNINYDDEFNCVKHVKKYLLNKKNIDTMIITREILDCAKIHVNVMIWTTALHRLKYHLLDGKQTSKYRIKSSYVKTAVDKFRVHEYIIKESKKRWMYPSNDIVIYTAKK